VSFKPAASFASAATEEFEEHRRRIVARVPRADVRHIGGTSLSGALTKGDLDVQVRVQGLRGGKDAFFAAVSAASPERRRRRH
jgi:GrpB-like predicted nucleotidyltransferase (UPF0157 family)